MEATEYVEIQLLGPIFSTAIGWQGVRRPQLRHTVHGLHHRNDGSRRKEPLVAFSVLRSSPSGRLHNEDGLSNGSDFSTFGKDETAKLPEKTVREHWDTRTHGWHQDGERHCFTSKFQVAGTIWTSKAQRRTAWRVLNELQGPGGEVEISACRREAEDGRHGGFLYKLKHSQHDDDAIEIERCNLERHPRPTSWESEISKTLIVCTTNS